MPFQNAEMCAWMIALMDHRLHCKKQIVKLAHCLHQKTFVRESSRNSQEISTFIRRYVHAAADELVYIVHN